MRYYWAKGKHFAYRKVINTNHYSEITSGHSRRMVELNILAIMSYMQYVDGPETVTQTGYNLVNRTPARENHPVMLNADHP